MVLPAVALIGSAVTNVALTAGHAVKMNKMQQGFQKKLDNDAARMDYIRLMVARFKSLGTRLARTTRHRPGTPEFNLLLKKALINDMFYRSYCNADIYWPMGKEDAFGKPRKVWGSINRSGFVKKPTQLPRDVGPIWASGCKNGHDEFSIAYANKFKGDRRFQHLKTHKIDVGTMNLLLRVGSGLFLMIVAILMIKIQRAVIREQTPFVAAKKKSKARKKAEKTTQ